MPSYPTLSVNEKTLAGQSKAEPGPQKESVATGGAIDKSLISAPKPGSFVHVAHMGYDVEEGFTSSGVDPSWLAFLGDLQKHGISEAVIEENMDFIIKFVRDSKENEAAPTGISPRRSKKVPPPPPRRHVQQGSTLSAATPPPALPLRTQSLGIPYPRTSRSPESTSTLVAPQLPVRAPPPPSRTSVAPPPVLAPAPPSCAISITPHVPPHRPEEWGTHLRHTTTTTTTTTATTTGTTTTTITTTTTTTTTTQSLDTLPDDG